MSNQFDTSNIQAAVSVFAVTVSAQSGKRVNVVFEGDDAFCDGETIYLPDTNVYRKRSGRLIALGYSAHEASHVLNTPMEEYANAIKDKEIPELYQSILNILEDVRIERDIVRRYPGTKKWIEAVIRDVRKKKEKGNMFVATEVDDIPYAVLGWLLTHSRSVYNQNTSLKSEVKKFRKAAVNMGVPEQMFTELSSALTKLIGIGGEYSGFCNLKALADEVYDIIISHLNSQQDSDDKQDPQSEGEGSDYSRQHASGSGNQESSQEEGTDQNGRPEADNNSSDQGEKQEEPDTGNADDKEDLKKLFESAGKYQVDLGGLAGQELADRGEGSSQRSRRRRSRMRVTLCDFTQNTQCDQSKAKLLSVPLRRSLQKLMDESIREEVRISRRGKVCRRKLHKVPLGDAKVFQKVTPGVKPSLAVHLLIDGSSSMCGWESEVANTASLALALACESLSIDVGVSAFIGSCDDRQLQILKLNGSGRITSKMQQNWGIEPQGTTPLGEAMDLAAPLLMESAKDYERKLLIVITDGKPDSVPAVEKAYQKAREKGVELFALGIGLPSHVDDWLNETFEGAVMNLSRVDELPQELFRVVINHFR